MQFLLAPLMRWGILPKGFVKKVSGYLGMRVPTCEQETDTNTTKDKLSNKKDSIVKTFETLKDYTTFLHSHDLVIVKFTAPWCKPCHRIQPFYESQALQLQLQLQKEKPSVRMGFGMIDVDENEEELGEIMKECSVKVLPAFAVWNKGVKVEVMKGSSEGKLKALLERSVDLLRST